MLHLSHGTLIAMTHRCLLRMHGIDASPWCSDDRCSRYLRSPHHSTTHQHSTQGGLLRNSTKTKDYKRLHWWLRSLGKFRRADSCRLRHCLHRERHWSYRNRPCHSLSGHCPWVGLVHHCSRWIERQHNHHLLFSILRARCYHLKNTHHTCQMAPYLPTIDRKIYLGMSWFAQDYRHMRSQPNHRIVCRCPYHHWSDHRRSRRVSHRRLLRHTSNYCLRNSQCNHCLPHLE